MKSVIALVYIRNGQEMIFPVNDMQHAIILADSIADSDILNDCIDYNMFDVCHYKNGVIGDSWESDGGEDFYKLWQIWRDFRRIK